MDRVQNDPPRAWRACWGPSAGAKPATASADSSQRASCCSGLDQLWSRDTGREGPEGQAASWKPECHRRPPTESYLEICGCHKIRDSVSVTPQMGALLTGLSVCLQGMEGAAGQLQPGLQSMGMLSLSNEQKGTKAGPSRRLTASCACVALEGCESEDVGPLSKRQFPAPAVP